MDMLPAEHGQHHRSNSLADPAFCSSQSGQNPRRQNSNAATESTTSSNTRDVSTTHAADGPGAAGPAAAPFPTAPPPPGPREAASIRQQCNRYRVSAIRPVFFAFLRFRVRGKRLIIAASSSAHCEQAVGSCRAWGLALRASPAKLKEVGDES